MLDQDIKILLITLAIAASYLGLWFVYSVYRKRFDLIDLAWGSVFVVVMLSALIASGENRVLLVSQLVVMFSVVAWAIRLMTHIYFRNLGRDDDARYMAMVSQYKKWPLLQVFFRIFMVQAVLGWMIAIPIILMFSADDRIVNSWLLAGGFLVWASGLTIESFADWQLLKFVKNPANKGKILKDKLWAYSRHPNYFGEVSVWWGVWLMTIAIYPRWWTVIGPLTISCLILFVSGIPMLEKRYKDNAQYQAYARRTSIFVPWFPKRR